jgi:phospholipid N-methyltransferase
MDDTAHFQETFWLTMAPQIDSASLSIGSHSIVELWERPIQEAMAEAVCGCPSSKILEIGYGLGLSATAVRSFNPSLHLIVEAHPEIAAKAIERFSPTAYVIVGLWERVTKSLRSSSFDGIIFDAYPMAAAPFDGSAESTFQHICHFLPEGRRLLRRGGKLAFIDFSQKLTQVEGFRSIIRTTFSNIHVKTVASSIPPSCSYACGNSGNIIILEK